MIMKSNKKLLLSVIWIVTGSVLLILSAIGLIDSVVYSGMGGGLVGIGILQVLRSIRYRRDPEYRELIDTEISDERNKYLRMRSWSIAGYAAVLLAAVGSVAALILGDLQLQQYLLVSMAVIVLIFLSAYYVLNRRY